MNKENDMNPKNANKKGYSKTYKYNICKGNNCQLVKKIMNQRYWWQRYDVDDMSLLNFLWTQWKIDRELEKLPSKIPKPQLKIVNDEDSDASENPDEGAEESEEECKVNSKVDNKNQQLPEQRLPHNSNKLYNRVEDNFKLTSKKFLFLNMRIYYESIGMDPYDVLPVTFHIKKGQIDEEFLKFKDYYMLEQEK